MCRYNKQSNARYKVEEGPRLVCHIPWLAKIIFPLSIISIIANDINCYHYISMNILTKLVKNIGIQCQDQLCQ